MSDFSQLFALVGRGDIPPPDVSDLRRPQRIVWRHVVDGYEVVESEDENGRVTGSRWVPLSICQNEPSFIRTNLTDQEARQAGVLLESGGGTSGLGVQSSGAAIIYLRPRVLLKPGQVLYVRAGSPAGSLYEVVSLMKMLDLFAREVVFGVRKVATVPSEVVR